MGREGRRGRGWVAPLVTAAGSHGRSLVGAALSVVSVWRGAAVRASGLLSGWARLPLRWSAPRLLSALALGAAIALLSLRRSLVAGLNWLTLRLSAGFTTLAAPAAAATTSALAASTFAGLSFGAIGRTVCRFSVDGID